MTDADRASGYNLALEGGKVHVHMVVRWLDDAIRAAGAELRVRNGVGFVD